MVFLPYYFTSENLLQTQQASPMPMPQHEMFPPNGSMLPPPMNGQQPFQNFGHRNDGFYYQMIFSFLLPFLFSFLSSLSIYRNNEKKELERSKAKTELLNLKYQL